jgi:SEC-C motif-containing protein
MKKQANPQKNDLRVFLCRIVLASTFTILFFYMISPFYFKLYLPLFKHQIELTHPEYTVIDYDIKKIRRVNYIQYLIKVNKEPIGKTEGLSGKKGSITRLKAQASSLSIVPIIIFTLILAWPGLSMRQRIKAIFLSIPLIVVIACVDYPFIFIAEIESVYSGGTLMDSIRLLWKHLLNNGGRQFLALIAFLISIAPIYITKPSVITNDKVGRNDPCPCGSGKKYKHCCLK